MPAKKPTPFVALRHAENWVSEQLRLVDEDETVFLAQVMKTTEKTGQGLLHCRADFLGIEVLSFVPLVHNCPKLMLGELAFNYLERIRSILCALRAENQGREEEDFDFGIWGVQWHPPRRSKMNMPSGTELVTGRWQVLGEDALYLPGERREYLVLWLVQLDNNKTPHAFQKIVTVTGIARNTKTQLKIRVGDIFQATFWAVQDTLYPIGQIEPDAISYGANIIPAGTRLDTFYKSPLCFGVPKPGDWARIIILQDVVFGRVGDIPVLYDPIQNSGALPLDTLSFSALAPLANRRLHKVVVSWNGFYATILRANTSHGPWFSTPKRMSGQLVHYLSPEVTEEAINCPAHIPIHGQVSAISCSAVRADTVSHEIRLILARMWNLHGGNFWWLGIRYLMDRAGVSVFLDDLQKYPLVSNRKPFSLASDVAWKQDYAWYQDALTSADKSFFILADVNFLAIQNIRRLRAVDKQAAYAETRILMNQGGTVGECWTPPLINAFRLALTQEDLPFLRSILGAIDSPRWRKEFAGLLASCPGSPSYEARRRAAAEFLQASRTTSAQGPTSETEIDLFARFGGFTFDDLCPYWPLTSADLIHLTKEWPTLTRPLAMVALESKDIMLAVNCLETAGYLQWPNQAEYVSLHFLAWTKHIAGESVAQDFIEKSFIPGRSNIGWPRDMQYNFLRPFSSNFSRFFVNFYFGDQSNDVETIRKIFETIGWDSGTLLLLFGDAIRPFISKMSFGANRLAFAIMELADALAGSAP